MPVRRRKAKSRQVFNRDAVRELGLFIENDGNLYRQMLTPINKNLEKKKAKGTYHPRKAEKAFRHLVDEGARRYTKDFGGHGNGGFGSFTPGDRAELSRQAARAFEVEYKSGNRHS
jgi:hypothetical protein